ncbi:MAG: VCBS repeat-containing protein [Marmoricola sp.]
MGILGFGNGAIIGHTQSQNGTRLGEWLLNTADNTAQLCADMDGDGVGELLISSPWGLGLLKMVSGGLRSVAMGQNGARFGGWIIDTTADQFHHAADFDGDGRDEVLVTSPWGVGLLAYDGSFTTRMLQPNGTRFGEWLLNTADNSFALVADVDGDGRAELVVTSPWGLGILAFRDGTLTSIFMAPNGSSFGDWMLDTATDSFEVAADVDGDGRSELLVRAPHGIALLRLEEDGLRTTARADNLSDLGGWVLNTADDKLGVAGDFNGDGRAEILVTGAAGMSLLTLEAGAIRASTTTPNGSRLGDWLLNTHDNRLNVANDFDGDGRSELMVSSPWGLGILKLIDGAFTAVTMSPNGTRFGGWLLNTADNDLEVGLGTKHGLIVWHSDWSNAVTNTGSFLQKRGYQVVSLSDPAAWLTELRRVALTTKPGDRVFVYLAGHGASGRTPADTSKATALTHWFQFGVGDGRIDANYSDFAPWFKLMGAKGADVSVFDGSCDAGETVMDAIGERYVGLSTTGCTVPGITNTPDPSHVMSQDGSPHSFGFWWSQEPTATAMFSELPHRFYQKIYRSDDTEASYWSLLYKVAINWLLAVGGGWEMWTRGCYLYKYAYPQGYADLDAGQKAGLTVALDPYLADMRSIRNDYQSALDQLRTILMNQDVVDRAAEVYSAAYPTPWRLLFGDPGWDIATDPVRTSPGLWEARPDTYAGHEGFRRMVDDILRILAVFERSYGEQEELLRKLDKAVQRRKLVDIGSLTLEPGFKRLPRILEYVLQNQYDERVMPRVTSLLEKTSTPRAKVTEELLQTPVRHVMEGRFDRRFVQGVSSVAKHVVVGLDEPTVEEVVQQLQALQTLCAGLMEQMFYELIIVEEAVSRVQAKGVELGDLVSY